jgi:hypothetical protein
MKKILFATAFLLSISFATMANNGKSTDPKAIAAFKKDFSGANDASWEEASDFSKVTFTINGSTLFAYYSANGELIAASRNISPSQLPINLFTGLKNEYSSYWISDLFEMSRNNSTRYYVTLENANEKKILRSTSWGWETYSSSIKE